MFKSCNYEMLMAHLYFHFNNHTIFYIICYQKVLASVDLLSASNPSQHKSLGCSGVTQRWGNHLTSVSEPQVISWQEQSQLEQPTEYLTTNHRVF